MNQSATLEDPSSAPAPHDDPDSGAPHPARRAGLWKAAVAVTVLLAGGLWWWRGAHTPAVVTKAAGALVLPDGTAVLSEGEWSYLAVADARLDKPLPPVPVAARVVADESRWTPVFATLPGRVEQVAVHLGQEVKTGDRLLAVRSSALPELNRDIESAQAALAVKTLQLERVRDLVKVGALAEKELLFAEQDRREVELSLAAAQGKRSSLRVGVSGAGGFFWITATRHGTVVERNVFVGMEVGPDRAVPLMAIAELDEVIVVADVLEADVQGISAGRPALIEETALGQESLPGQVEYVADAVDPVRRTVAVRVRVANPGHKLRPNAFAQVTFVPEGADRVVVPSEAVVTDGETHAMFVARARPGTRPALEKRSVEVGRVRGGRTEILSGLRVGESFVAKGAIMVLNTLELAR